MRTKNHRVPGTVRNLAHVMVMTSGAQIQVLDFACDARNRSSESGWPTQGLLWVRMMDGPHANTNDGQSRFTYGQGLLERHDWCTTPLDETNPSPDNLPSRQDLKVSKRGSVLSTHDGFGRTTTPGSRVQFLQSLGSVSGLPMAGSDYTLIPPLPRNKVFNKTTQHDAALQRMVDALHSLGLEGCATSWN